MSFGFDHEAFWDQTARTLQITFAAVQDREIREHNNRAWLAHTIGALGRVKDFPRLETLMAKPKRKPMSVEEATARVIAWNKSVGGTFIDNRAKAK